MKREPDNMADSEARIRQLNRLLRTIVEINQVIVRASDRETLLSEACCILVEHGGFRMAWVGLLDGEKRLVLPAARAGEVSSYLDGLSLRFDEDPGMWGPVRTAIRTGRHVVVPDLLADPAAAPWRERMLKHGFRTTGTFPFRVRGEVAGAVTVYSAEAGAIGEEEIALLDELAGDVGYALGAIEEHADRQRAEKALRESETKLRAFFDANVIGILFGDVYGNIAEANDELLRAVGYSREDLHAGRLRWIDITPPEFLPLDDRGIAQAREWGTCTPYEKQYVRKDGSCVWVLVGYVLLPPEREKSVAFVLDISERKRIEEELARSELYYRSLIENAVDITAVLTPLGEVRYASPSVERILGYPPAALLGRNMIEFAHPDDRPEVAGRIRRLLEEGSRFERLDVRLRHGDGSWRVVSAIGAVLPPETGIPGMIINGQDVTEHRQLEAQLRQSQKMEAIGVLAGGVAHDFNNLLTAILGNADLAFGRLPGGHPVLEDLSEIRKAGERAASLTSQLLAFSRKQVVSPVVLDPNAVVQDLEKMLRRLIGESISLGTSLEPGLGRIRADRGQVEQVIMNLAVNARDAMPGGGQLTIETRNVNLGADYVGAHAYVPPGPYVLLAVSDTGIGMDEGTRSRIFEPFFTTKEPGRGTGLGLSTVYGIVKQSGGSIEVYSEPGTGTTFKIYFPRVEAAPQSNPARAEIASPRGGETVLLVEDDDGVRKLVCVGLESYGYTVLPARDVAEALRVAEEHPWPIPIVVTDVVMPGASGKELALALETVRPSLKVLFISGYTDDAIVRHGVLEPGVAFLQKPFSPAALARKVREVLDTASPESGEAKLGTTR